MKKKTETKKKKVNFLLILAEIVFAVLCMLVLPILLDKGTNIAYKLMYPKQKD